MKLYQLFKIKSAGIIISPSGNLYGSEKVLIDFLQHTKKKYVVFVPAKSELYSELIKLGTQHKILEFKSLLLLYFSIFLLLLLKKKSIYINEGAHIRYAQILAKLLPYCKISIHIRIIEDCQRISKPPKNLQVITITNFLAQKIQYPNLSVIYDAFPIKPFEANLKPKPDNYTITVGIIGRITASKGINLIFPIIDQFEKDPRYRLSIIFFGTYNNKESNIEGFINKTQGFNHTKCIFPGFEKNQHLLYNSIDMVIHLNQNEPLGRIIFESISYNKPIITFNKGGAGELMQLLELESHTVNAEDPDWSKLFKELILSTYINPPVQEISMAKKIIQQEFTIEKYVEDVERIIY